MKTLIVGGGLSGLVLADALEANGHDYMLVEARKRIGGSEVAPQFGGYIEGALEAAENALNTLED